MEMESGRGKTTLLGYVVAIVVTLPLLIVFFSCWRVEGPCSPATCKANLGAIGKAMALYAEDSMTNSFPWIAASAWDQPVGSGANWKKAPDTSLARSVTALP